MWQDIVQHLKLNFDHAGSKYNFLQKLAYGLVLGVFLPGIVLTGMAMSPGVEPGFSWMIELMGGRQSARSLHFIFSWAIFSFFVLHIVLVMLAGPIGQIRAMIAGGTLDDDEGRTNRSSKDRKDSMNLPMKRRGMIAGLSATVLAADVRKSDRVTRGKPLFARLDNGIKTLSGCLAVAGW